ALLKQAGLQVFEIPGTTIASSMIPGKNNPRLWSQSPISNLKVREAMLLAINRQEIADTIMGGFAKVAVRHAIDPSGEGFDPAWRPETFDPQRAKQLLSEAGYPNGFDLRAYVFPYSGAAWFVPIMEAMAGYWTSIGIPVKLIPSELGTISRLYAQRPQGTDMVGTTFLLPSFVRQQPLSGLEAVYASTSQVNLIPAPEVMDTLLFKAQTTLDASERVRLTKEIVNLAHGERLALPIVTAGALYGAAKDLDGWRPIQGLSMIGTILENLKPKR
ncbi:MAG: hypothetical protein HYX97_01630, partial [Chloroflexi bacterium]|nr:hypothetical protein [Chloroflexota bacterium]